jgi:hypothetical protein
MCKFVTAIKRGGNVIDINLDNVSYIEHKKTKTEKYSVVHFIKKEIKETAEKDDYVLVMDIYQDIPNLPSKVYQQHHPNHS